MSKRGKKVTLAEWERIKRLRISHGVVAVASETGRSKSVIYKLESRDRHFKDLTDTLLLIAKNLEKYMHNNRKLAAQVTILNYLLRVITPDTQWADKLVNLLRDYTNINKIEMGFNTAWYEDSFWQ